jgi:leishmanolysin
MWKGAYHCNTTQLSGCTYNREAEGYCPILSYNGELPQWARYFPQPNKGGQSSLADYCTYFVAYSDGSCTDINSARAPDRMLGEVRGSESRLFNLTLSLNVCKYPNGILLMKEFDLYIGVWPHL